MNFKVLKASQFVIRVNITAPELVRYFIPGKVKYAYLPRNKKNIHPGLLNSFSNCLTIIESVQNNFLS